MVKIEIAKKFLDSLHGHFMITPVDKVNGNITVISKPFYIKVLIKGLGIVNKLNANSTYENLPNNNKDVLILSNSRLIQKNFISLKSWTKGYRQNHEFKQKRVFYEMFYSGYFATF